MMMGQNLNTENLFRQTAAADLNSTADGSPACESSALALRQPADITVTGHHASGIGGFRIVCSNRKTIALEINFRGVVTIRAPYNVDPGEISGFVREKESWIRTKVVRINQKREEAEEQGILTKEDLEHLRAEAKVVIPQRVQYYADLMGVIYRKITLRIQKSKWGSCTSLGDLNFNTLLMLAPPKVLDYVIVHELCHRLHMDHSDAYWEKVKKFMPDYAERRRWLGENGVVLLMRGGVV